MLLKEYVQFVDGADWTRGRDPEERTQIARYGFAAEVGALATALKKKLLHHPPENWRKSNQEIIEELGDCFWYATQLCLLQEGYGLVAAIKDDLTSLQSELDSSPDFRGALSPESLKRFEAEAPDLISRGDSVDLDEYQEVAYLTARTTGKELVDVCLTRLLLYSTAIMSRQFPEMELTLKQDIPEYSQRVLGMVIWHLSAVARIYDLTLSEIATANRQKLDSVTNRTDRLPTDFYDKDAPEEQRFPRRFEVAYISTKPGKLQMFYRGHPLGDELDDNATTDDGYRFHDALHLANVAILGWSPVLRSLMGLKRKHDPDKDRVEDGARARIVEEAVVKAVHSEAIRVAALEGLEPSEARRRLFSEANQIQYHFLQLIMSFADGLEVSRSEPWEWRKAIVEGHRLFAKLNQEKQGTVSVNMDMREVCFSPLVIADTRGPVVDTIVEVFDSGFIMRRALKKAEKVKVETRAILRMLGIRHSKENYSRVRIEYSDEGDISVKASGVVQHEIWKRGIVGFRAQWTKAGSRHICTAMAIGVPTQKPSAN